MAKNKKGKGKSNGRAAQKGKVQKRASNFYVQDDDYGVHVGKLVLSQTRLRLRSQRRLRGISAGSQERNRRIHARDLRMRSSGTYP
jgi:hypothetical protein